MFPTRVGYPKTVFTIPDRIHRLLAVSVLTASCSPVQTADPDPTRGAFDEWLRTSVISPYAAVYHQPFGGRLEFGPSALPPLDEVPAAVLEENGRLSIETEEGGRAVPRNRAFDVGGWQVLVSGGRGSSFVTVFRPDYVANPPGWYEMDSAYTVAGDLARPETGDTRPMLGLDGVRVEARLAGWFTTTLRDEPVRLMVYRMAEPGTGDEELNIFFRDATNGNGTYPAGRFLTLRPLGGQRYVADFNRARNPFCAYNAIYPCPLPWRGNELGAAVAAGERYNGGGLEIIR